MNGHKLVDNYYWLRDKTNPEVKAYLESENAYADAWFDQRRPLVEELYEEIKRRTHVVRIFPNAESCLRLVRALAVETHENWLEQHRYLNMEDLREHKKEQLRLAA